MCCYIFVYSCVGFFHAWCDDEAISITILALLLKNFHRGLTWQNPVLVNIKVIFQPKSLNLTKMRYYKIIDEESI